MDMNKEQCESIMQTTCYVLDSNSEIEETLQSYGIEKKDLAKVSKALDLINEVNQTYAKKMKGFKHG